MAKPNGRGGHSNTPEPPNEPQRAAEGQESGTLDGEDWLSAAFAAVTAELRAQAASASAAAHDAYSAAVSQLGLQAEAGWK